jgi:hypothetical protein
MDKRDGKAQFAALRDAVSQALRDADPIGLITDGAPVDEYDSEVGTVLPRLRGASSSADVRVILHEEFIHWFGDEVAGGIERYDRAAESIWAILSTNKAV